LSASTIQPPSNNDVNQPGEENPSADGSFNEDAALLGVDIASDIVANENYAREKENDDLLQELLTLAEQNFDKLKDTFTPRQTWDDIDEEANFKNKESLRQYRQYAKAGLEYIMRHDLVAALNQFNKAINANASQPLLQRGMTCYLLGDYNEAVNQFEKDLKILENVNLKLYKATDMRLWLSAAYNKLDKREEAIRALDLKNHDLQEERYLFRKIMEFYAGDIEIDAVLTIVGNAAVADPVGTLFYGNFYLGLYFDSMNQKEMVGAFLDIPVTSNKFPKYDLWFHIPRLLLEKVQK
jgi:tetratricopeptide (TPR) repeat protein